MKKTTLTEIKSVTHSLDRFFDEKYGFVNRAGVSGQLGWDAIRVMHPLTGEFATWVVDVDLINAGINDHMCYSDLDEGWKPTQDWKTAVARAVKKAITEYDIALELS